MVLLMLLLPLLVDHPTMYHDVFTLLASRRFPPETLRRYLREMAALHAAYWHRPETTLRMLGREGRTEQAAILDKLFVDEELRKERFAQMAHVLTNGMEPASWDTNRALESLRRRETDEIVGGIIRNRTFNALGALGEIFALEVAMDAQIIPCETTAFITSGYYDLTREKVPFLAYRPSTRISAMCAIVDAAPTSEEGSDELKKGFLSTLPRLHAFYDGLEQILRSAA